MYVTDVTAVCVPIRDGIWGVAGGSVPVGGRVT